jgi:hypothetical protein
VRPGVDINSEPNQHFDCFGVASSGGLVDGLPAVAIFVVQSSLVFCGNLGNAVQITRCGSNVANWTVNLGSSGRWLFDRKYAMQCTVISS